MTCSPTQQWHVLAVDLLALDPLEVTHQLALKVFVDAGGSARLEISQLWFANELPAEAQVARQPSQRPQEVATAGMGDEQAPCHAKAGPLLRRRTSPRRPVATR